MAESINRVCGDFVTMRRSLNVRLGNLKSAQPPHRVVKAALRHGRVRCRPRHTGRVQRMDIEGRYSLSALVTPTADKPGRWTAKGVLHVEGAATPIETALAGDSFDTPQVAEVAAIEAARQVASTRDDAPGDAIAVDPA
ncbi:hypothetical protein [Luteimonas fraxinea]|uniref:hypothetical protein n=1 Tax=Luteimonas fraxinea TaxID=2901869 RepID=UPI001E5A9E10|nr:hypothetical protein [Luteimonas fraxinea]MCD9124246.1 hypothetical protein [Luteimonas fraxinea]